MNQSRRRILGAAAAAIAVAHVVAVAKLVLATATSAKAMAATLGGLGIEGKLFIIGAAADTFEVSPLLLISGRRSIAGWPSGRSIDTEDTLVFNSLAGVRSMSEIYPLERAAEAYDRMMSGKARWRACIGRASGDVYQ